MVRTAKLSGGSCSSTGMRDGHGSGQSVNSSGWFGCAESGSVATLVAGFASRPPGSRTAIPADFK